jgi:hypothetical protein
MSFLANIFCPVIKEMASGLVRDQGSLVCLYRGELSKFGGVLFSNQAAQIPCPSSLEINRATCGGRIYDSQARRLCPSAQATVFAIFKLLAERE